MKFERRPMVGWYQVKQLATLGIKSLVSAAFGAYADRREIQAALSGPDVYDFSEGDALWIDYVSDVGEGFDSTFSVATLLAQQQLTVDGSATQRGHLLIMGGDEVYPSPEIHEYDNRLRGPYAAALPLREDDCDPPALFAIPGNHDWYDGLSNFLKVFCQERPIGNWRTQQKRSYFAIKLPHRYWIWGIDVQLNADIDLPQKNYFQDIVDKDMQVGDQVILCTAEPSWIYKDRYRMNESYDRLKYFEEELIHQNGFRLVATLTGDLHHYSRYADMKEGHEGHQRIISGGGGAFLHPTHNLNERLEKIEDEHLELKSLFPDKETSRRLTFLNLRFPYYNPSFSFFLGAFYLLMAWVLETDASYTHHSLLELLSQAEHVGSALDVVFRVLIRSPLAFILSLLLALGFIWFADTNAGKSRLIWVIGIAHGVMHLVGSYLLTWLFARINLHVLGWPLVSVQQVALFALEMLTMGSIVGGILVGIYLLFTNLVLGVHDNEAFSAIRCADYKNFLRLHLTNESLTIYPIGIRQVTKDWKQLSRTEEQPRFHGSAIKTHLIEQPIVIDHHRERLVGEETVKTDGIKS